LAVRGKCVKLAPDGKSFACVTTEGITIFSLSEKEVFAPVDLNLDITLNSALSLYQENRFIEALIVSLKLDYKELTTSIYNSLPFAQIPLFCKNFPKELALKFLGILANELEQKTHVELTVHWIRSMLSASGEFIKEHLQRALPYLRMLQRNIAIFDEIFRLLVEDNTNLLKYYAHTAASASTAASAGSEGVNKTEYGLKFRVQYQRVTL